MKKPKTKNGEGGYSAIHQWLRRNYGFPEKCSWCGIEGRKLGQNRGKWSIEFALKSGHSYKHDITSFEPLCMSCHRTKDYEESPQMQDNFRKGWLKRRTTHGLNRIDPRTGRFVKTK